MDKSCEDTCRWEDCLDCKDYPPTEEYKKYRKELDEYLDKRSEPGGNCTI
jgi:hypothetical protein